MAKGPGAGGGVGLGNTWRIKQWGGGCLVLQLRAENECDEPPKNQIRKEQKPDGETCLMNGEKDGEGEVSILVKYVRIENQPFTLLGEGAGAGCFASSSSSSTVLLASLSVCVFSDGWAMEYSQNVDPCSPYRLHTYFAINRLIPVQVTAHTGTGRGR